DESMSPRTCSRIWSAGTCHRARQSRSASFGNSRSRAQRSSRCPWGRASPIARVAPDLAGVSGPRIVVVLSDGAENCGGNPAQAIRKLRREGLDVTVNVVGLGLDRQ